MNLDIYTEEMAKSVWDKAFFMDKIPGAKCVIDFGCADGAMIRFLGKLFPNIDFVGYDISPVLISRAQCTAPFLSNVVFFSHYTDVIEYVQGTKKYEPKEICLNFSSVLHEVFSSTGGVMDIQYLVTHLQPQYITIRDMYCDDPVPFTSIESFRAVYDQLPKEYCKEFIDKFDLIKDWRDLTHLMMKLQWKDNGWQEELKENYFSWTLDKFMDLFKPYIPCFEARYQLPYLSEKWKLELGWYNPDVHTHAQFILRRDN